MGKFSVVIFLFLSSLMGKAQQLATSGDSARHYHIPADISITMADGQAKKISEIRAGEPIRCVKAGQVATNCIRKVEAIRNAGTWLTALYLKPVDEQKASAHTWPLVPALLLETAPTLTVTTTEGPKTIGQLKKGDILYRYEPDTQRVSAWKVGIVHRKARWVNTLYALVTEEGSYLLENMMAVDR